MMKDELEDVKQLIWSKDGVNVSITDILECFPPDAWPVRAKVGKNYYYYALVHSLVCLHWIMRKFAMWLDGEPRKIVSMRRLNAFEFTNIGKKAFETLKWGNLVYSNPQWRLEIIIRAETSNQIHFGALTLSLVKRHLVPWVGKQYSWASKWVSMLVISMNCWSRRFRRFHFVRSDCVD